MYLHSTGARVYSLSALKFIFLTFSFSSFILCTDQVTEVDVAIVNFSLAVFVSFHSSRVGKTILILDLIRRCIPGLFTQSSHFFNSSIFLTSCSLLRPEILHKHLHKRKVGV